MQNNVFTLTVRSTGHQRSVSVNILDDKTTTLAYVLPNPNQQFVGGYGIDWCEMKNEKTVEKFQGVELSNISHIFDDTTKTFTTTGITEDKKQELIKAIYDTQKAFVEIEYTSATNTTSEKIDYVPMWINLPQNKTVNIDIKLFVKGDPKPKEYVTFKKNANFEITYSKPITNPTTKEITYETQNNEAIRMVDITNNKTHENISIKALTTFNTTQYITLVTLVEDKEIEVGKIEMEANNVVELGVKIIPVVIASTRGNTERQARTNLENAIAIHETALAATHKLGAIENNLENTLNTFVFAQAGVRCVISPIVQPTPEHILIDPTQGNWSHFYDNGTFKDWEFELGATDKPAPWTDEDGNDNYYTPTSEMTKRPLLNQLEDTYYATYGRDFRGTLIFVTDKEFDNPLTGGYSQTSPLRSQGTIIFNGSSSNADAYAHELGHMLGLSHTFIEADDISRIQTSITDQLTPLTGNILIRDERAITFEESKQFLENSKRRLTEKPNNLQAKKEVEAAEKFLSEDKESFEEVNKLVTDATMKISIEKNCEFRITQTSTQNYLDYEITRLYLQRHQAKRIKEEVIKFYQ